MTTPRFLQIHTLQSYPAALLNRDDSGLAKRLLFGGVTRTRISSQCLKRHWRVADDEWGLRKIEDIDFAVRSRLIFSRAIFRHLVIEEGFEENRTRAVVAQLKDRLFPIRDADKEKGTSDKKDPLDTEQAFLLGDPEIVYMREIVRRILNGDDELGKSLAEAPKKKQKTQFQTNLMDNLTALRNSSTIPTGLESALFGRMVTSDLIANTDAAIHVAHAFTVHPEESESDYFSVCEDLREEDDDAGAAHINETELDSGLYYGYVVVDVPALVSNLEGCPAKNWSAEATSRELAGKVVQHLCHLIAKVSPGAKLGSTAPYAYARLTLIEAGSRQPRSLANAFRDPLRWHRDQAGTKAAIDRLGEEIASLDECYGCRETRRFSAIEKDASIPAAERLPFDDLAAWVADAIRAAKA